MWKRKVKFLISLVQNHKRKEKVFLRVRGRVYEREDSIFGGAWVWVGPDGRRGLNVSGA